MSRFTHCTRVALRLACIAATAFTLNVQAETILVSRSSEGEQGRDFSTFPSISDDGRFIAFMSKADNLVPGDTNGELDVFVHDRETRQTTRVSVASDGSEANGGMGWTVDSISGNGRFVVFSSSADNLVSGDNNRAEDVFVHDRESGETNRISVTGNGAETNGNSYSPGISGNGRYVTFESGADNLVAGDTNGLFDVFLLDRETGLIRRVNVASDGSEAEVLNHDWSWIWWYNNPVSNDGRYVAFTSWSGNLVPGDTNAVEDVFIHDLETGQTERVSFTRDSRQSSHSSLLIDMSDDGRYVAFFSAAGRNGPEDDPEPSGLYVHDRGTGLTSHLPYGSGWAAFSNDGRYLAYDHYSWAEDPLLPKMPSGTYVIDQQTGETVRATVSYRGNPVVSNSWHVAISGDGRTVAFNSRATNLVPGDINSKGDVFTIDNPHFFRINAGLNDAWYDPETPGQGFHVTAFPQTQKLFVSWLTFDAEQHGHSDSSPLGGRNQRWLTAYGPYEGRKATLEVSSTMGGIFDSAEPAPTPYSNGTLTVDFTHCTNGTVAYDFPSIDRRRVIPIQRVSLENVPLCELLNGLE